MAWVMLRMPAPTEDVPTDISRLVRVGRVASVDLAQASCTIAFGDPDSDDGEVESLPVKWATARAGTAKIWLPPSIGEQIVFLCPEGELAAAVPIASLWSDANPPNGNTARALVTFDDGAELAYDPQAHHAEISLPAGATFSLTADGGITFTGDMVIEGNVTLNGSLDATDDVTSGGISLQHHTHSGVQAGGASSGPPE